MYRLNRQGDNTQPCVSILIGICLDSVESEVTQFPDFSNSKNVNINGNCVNNLASYVTGRIQYILVWPTGPIFKYLICWVRVEGYV